MTTSANDRSHTSRTTQVEDAAEAFVEMLNSNGVHYLFLNSGTDTFPVQEAIVRMREQERRTPEVVLCIDEVTGMFAAHGYYQLQGRPQAVLVHVDAGTAQIGGAYHDVQRDRAGVVVFAGRAPATIGKAVPGAKDLTIHWTQEQRDQNGIVRTFTKCLTSGDRKRIASRVERYRAASAARRKAIEAAALKAASNRPLSPLWIGYCLEQAIGSETVVMNEAMSGSEPWTSVANRSQPGTVFTSGGSSLGWALGAALGAKLATPDRDVVALQGDGSFVYARPTSAFWAAEKYNAPFLTIIYNNSRHRATVRNWDRHYPEGVGKRTGRYVGVDIDPSPDYDVLATACRAYGERVDDPDQVSPAIRRGLARIRDGQTALLDMRIER